MAKMENLNFLKQILTNQLNVRIHTPKNVDFFPHYKNHDLPLKA